MNIIAVTSQKGGSGKTTLAGHLAVAASMSGQGRVGLVDTDPQGSLADWWNERADPYPAFLHTHVTSLESDLARARDLGFATVFVDTPPAITETIERVMALSDLVLVPTRPSPHDLCAVGTTIAMAVAFGRPLIFVINAANPRTRITGEAAIVLSQHGTVAPVTVHQRTDFAASMIDGRTVMEVARAERSAEEIARLWTYIDGRLAGSRKPKILPASFAQLGGQNMERDVRRPVQSGHHADPAR